MRRNSITLAAVAALVLPLAFAYAQAPRPSAAPAARPAQAPAPASAAEMAKKMDQLLVAWERQSSLLKTLDVKIKRRDKAKAWQVDETYEGRAILKAPNLAYLNFDKVVEEKGQKKLVHAEQIRCTGTEVWQYRFDVQQIIIYPLDREQRKRALEEGPLPFLFNMKAAEAKARYTMHFLQEDDKSYIISVVPKLEIDQDSFSKAFVQLDHTYLLPRRILLIHQNGTDTRDYVLDPTPQAEVDDRNFRGQLVKGWQVVRDAGGKPQNAPAQDARQPLPRGGARAGRG